MDFVAVASVPWANIRNHPSENRYGSATMLRPYLPAFNQRMIYKKRTPQGSPNPAGFREFVSSN